MHKTDELKDKYIFKKRQEIQILPGFGYSVPKGTVITRNKKERVYKVSHVLKKNEPTLIVQINEANILEQLNKFEEVKA